MNSFVYAVQPCICFKIVRPPRTFFPHLESGAEDSEVQDIFVPLQQGFVARKQAL